MSRSYWLDLFSATTWEQFQKSGSTITGFRETQWKTMQNIAVGDYFLCYLTGVSRFIGILEVASEPFKNYENDIWKDDDFPCRFNVTPIIELTPETAIPVSEFKNSLSPFQNLKNPNAWTGAFRASPRKWKNCDGDVILNALLEAKENPISRPVDARKLKYRPKMVRAEIGSVTIPEVIDNDEQKTDDSVAKKPTDHTEIQWLLLKLGSDMGFDVWVARNDRAREYKGKKFTDIPQIKTKLPLQFDNATNKTIELIDVLWLDGNAIISAFEIESTTSIYSGLLRMSDLIAMQPNINIPLYLVAPDDKREKVMSEVNRATFTRLNPPLSEICRYISFNGLKEQIDRAAIYIKFLKPEFLDELSESCELEDA